MNDYSKTVIYKIQHNDDDSLLYVGHTTNFIKRKNYHKNDCKSSKKLVYKMIRENGGWECFTMIVIKEYPCDNKMEARIKEDKVMREMNAPGAEAASSPELPKEPGGGADGMAEDAEEIPGRPVFSVGAREE